MYIHWQSRSYRKSIHISKKHKWILPILKPWVIKITNVTENENWPITQRWYNKARPTPKTIKITNPVYRE
jgi:hypothetical protein